MVACRRLVFGALACLLIGSSAILCGIEAKPAEEDPDFAIQGEYLGEIATAAGKETVGVQLVARGAGKFKVLCYRGGLPGDGWNKEEPMAGEAEAVDRAIHFQLAEWNAETKEGLLAITNKQGVEVGRLKKILRRSSTLGAKPPKGAVVLFDGRTADTFENGQLTEEGLLKPGATSKARLGSGTLHIEFLIPFDPQDPNRGNSGCYLQSRYEVQILDSFGVAPHHHECGGIPGVKAADFNMTFPPGSWQTYDVEFTAPVFQDGKKVKSAIMSVKQNGIETHHEVEVPFATQSAPLAEGPEPGPLNLQEHGGQVRFRNIWFLERK